MNKKLISVLIILFVPIFLALIKITSEFVQLLFNTTTADSNFFGIILVTFSIFAAVMVCFYPND